MFDRLKLLIRRYVLRVSPGEDCGMRCLYNVGGNCYRYSYEFGCRKEFDEG